MAIGKSKFPLDDITGVLGQIDRSVGKDGGLAICMGKNPNSTILGVKTKRTTTRSPAQIERAAIYCACDKAWEALSFWKKLYTCTYRKKVQGKSTQRFSNYLCWMSICLGNEWDENLFRMNSYVSRYVIQNTSGTTWTDHKVTLIDIPTKTDSGIDLTVQQTDYKRLPSNTLNHKVGIPGSAIVCLPEMAPGRTIYIDVYSHGDYSTAQNCTAQTPDEIDQYLLQTLSFPTTFRFQLDIDIYKVAPRSGFVYMPISIAPEEGSVKLSGFTINTGTPEHVGVCNNKHGILYVDLFRMGEITAGLPIIASGRLTRNNTQNYDCDCPSIVTSKNISCGSQYPKSIMEAYPGGFGCCAGDYNPIQMIIVQGETTAQIAPKSITKIGPTW